MFAGLLAQRSRAVVARRLYNPVEDLRHDNQREFIQREVASEMALFSQQSVAKNCLLVPMVPISRKLKEKEVWRKL
jgi:hypothetical protein